MVYKFSEATHTHSVDGKKLRGVTSVLKDIVAKNALLPWAVKITCEYIKDNLKDIKDIDEVIENAKKAPTKKKEDAGNIGKKIHQSIEDYIKEGSTPSCEYSEVEDAFTNFINWVSKNSVVFLDSEKHVFNEEINLAGIIDGVILMDGKKWIYDTKSGKKIYEDVFLQLAAYDILNGEKADGYVVLNLGKDGSFEEKRTTEVGKWKDGFRAVLLLHNLLKQHAL